MSSNIVHNYFKKVTKEGTIYLKYNPIQCRTTELFISTKGKSEISHLKFEGDIIAELMKDGFVECGPLEFNLHYAGLMDNPLQ